MIIICIKTHMNLIFLDNIKIRFFEVDTNDTEVWSDYGKFSHIDVHHQYAIVFK